MDLGPAIKLESKKEHFAIEKVSYFDPSPDELYEVVLEDLCRHVAVLVLYNVLNN